MTSSRLSTPRPPPQPRPMWQGGGQEPRGALGGASVTSRGPEAREMAKAQSPQGGTLFDISFPNHVVSVLAQGGADFSRGVGVSGD